MTSPDPSPGRGHPPGLVVEQHASAGGQAQQLPPVREQSPQHQLPFQPLFTLVTDSTTHATHHPQVHYVFSDDDPEILTQALARHGHHSDPPPDPSASRSPLPQAAPNERAIVLDLVPKPPGNTNPTSSAPRYDVAWASSLTPSWAVVAAKTSAMTEENSTIAANPDGEAGAGQRLVLRIEGVADNAILSVSAASQIPGTRARGPPVDERDLRMSASSPSAAAQDKAREDYGAIVDEFDKRMGILRKVVDAGLERQRGAPTHDVPEDELPVGAAIYDRPGGLPPGHGQEPSAPQQGGQRGDAI